MKEKKVNSYKRGLKIIAVAAAIGGVAGGISGGLYEATKASGIGIACVAAEVFDVPVVFAKKTQTKNIAGDVYTTKVESFTHGRVYDIIVSREFLGKGDKVLLIDDFLANGKALEGLAELVKKSGAELVGAGVVIEKGFQVGGDIIRSKGIHLESLAIVESMDEKTGEVVFRN